MAYFSKNEYGNYKIPLEKQRPIFLLGAPGIGKTAIMEQIAQELNVGLVSYSMTHHTRQSALGLPKILKKTYQEKEFIMPDRTKKIRRVASVNPAVCQGCGACTVTCPSGAMDLSGFSNKQIMAEVDAICR